MTAPATAGGLAHEVLISRVLCLLGWDGMTIVKARALSTARLVVCALDHAEHQRRAAEGLVPVVDPLLLRCMCAERPGFLSTAAPVCISGAIAMRQTWRSAVRNLAGFGAFGARVAVLPAREAHRLEVAAGAVVEGYGVVAVDDENTPRLIHHPNMGAIMKSRTWIDCLIEEIVYDAVLAAGNAEYGVTAATRPPSPAGSPADPSRPSSQAGVPRT